MDIRPVHRLSASDQVFNQIKENLICGNWKTGEKLPSENELAAAFGVSRITIRQALSRLTALGLLETRFGEGTFVSDLNLGIYMQDMLPIMYLNSVSSHDSAFEMMEFRLMYETEAAAIAAQRITDEALDQMEKVIHNMRLHLNGENEISHEAYVEEDLNFHMQIAEATRNSLVIQLNSIMSDVIRSGIQNTVFPETLVEGQKMHETIYNALKAHDSEKAREAMSKHLRFSLEKHRRSGVLCSSK